MRKTVAVSLILALLVCASSVFATKSKVVRAKGTPKIVLPKQKPTGLSYTDAECRQRLLARPEIVAKLHKNGLTVVEMCKVNSKIKLGYYRWQTWGSRKHQRVVVFDYGIPKRIIKTCSGRAGDRCGLFMIDFKQIMHISSGIPSCEGVEMPYALHFELREGGRYLHASKKMRRYPDSLGCFRLYRYDARDLFIVIVVQTPFLVTNW